jgi:hypothetical protein
VLTGQSDQGAHAPGPGDGVDAADEDGSCVWRQQSRQDSYQRRLTGAVPAQQADDRTGLNLQVHAAQGNDLTKALDDPFDAHHGAPSVATGARPAVRPRTPRLHYRLATEIRGVAYRRRPRTGNERALS